MFINYCKRKKEGKNKIFYSFGKVLLLPNAILFIPLIKYKCWESFLIYLTFDLFLFFSEFYQVEPNSEQVFQ